MKCRKFQSTLNSIIIRACLLVARSAARMKIFCSSSTIVYAHIKPRIWCRLLWMYFRPGFVYVPSSGRSHCCIGDRYSSVWVSVRIYMYTSCSGPESNPLSLLSVFLSRAWASAAAAAAALLSVCFRIFLARRGFLVLLALVISIICENNNWWCRPSRSTLIVYHLSSARKIFFLICG